MATWILAFLKAGGYPALVLLATIECLFPPLPSELIFPLAGYLARDGELSVWGCALSGAIGGMLGTLPLYFIGKKVGLRRVHRFIRSHGRWAAISIEELQRSERWFTRRGGRAVFLAHLVPGVRSLIALPAGVARMPLLRFMFFSFAGAGVWSGLLAAAGYGLGAAFGRVERLLDPVMWVVLVLLILWYFKRVIWPLNISPGGDTRSDREAIIHQK